MTFSLMDCDLEIFTFADNCIGGFKHMKRCFLVNFLVQSQVLHNLSTFFWAHHPSRIFLCPSMPFQVFFFSFFTIFSDLLKNIQLIKNQLLSNMPKRLRFDGGLRFENFVKELTKANVYTRKFFYASHMYRQFLATTPQWHYRAREVYRIHMDVN